MRAHPNRRSVFVTQRPLPRSRWPTAMLFVVGSYPCQSGKTPQQVSTRHMQLALQTIAIYLTRVAPALLIGVVLLFLTRGQAKSRIAIYLALFILLRDAMTPLGLWSFGSEG